MFAGPSDKIFQALRTSAAGRNRSLRSPWTSSKERNRSFRAPRTSPEPRNKSIRAPWTAPEARDKSFRAPWTSPEARNKSFWAPGTSAKGRSRLPPFRRKPPDPGNLPNRPDLESTKADTLARLLSTNRRKCVAVTRCHIMPCTFCPPEWRYLHSGKCPSAPDFVPRNGDRAWPPPAVGFGASPAMTPARTERSLAMRDLDTRSEPDARSVIRPRTPEGGAPCR